MNTPIHFSDLHLSPNLYEFGPYILGGQTLGPFAIRWYALAYIGSLLLGWRIMRRLVRLDPPVATHLQTDDFLTWATLGVVLGGRLGYVLFYKPLTYLGGLGLLFRDFPAFWRPENAETNLFAVWTGGMSFHGGVVGVVIALILFCRQQRIPLLGFADRLAVVVPMGLGIGRLANFINGELWGREAPATLPWAIIFDTTGGGPLPRHPSQLYQAGMEGFLLLLVLALLCRREAVRARFGTLTGMFLVGYGIARIIGETFRQPDKFLFNGGFISADGPLGALVAGTTLGQWLCIPMILAGLWLIARARAQPVPLMAA